MASSINWRRNLYVVWLSQFLGMIGFGCAMPFIPMLLRDRLGITDDAVRGMYVAAYQFCGMISFCFATAFWGILADKLGYKLMLLRATYTATLMFPLLAFAPNVGILLLLRFLTSFFSGTYNAAQTLLITTSPPEKHGFVLGTLSTALWSGQMSGYMVGGVIVEFFGYNAAFISCGVLYLISAILVQFFARDGFTPALQSDRKKKKSVPLRTFLAPEMLCLLALFLTMGIARRIDEPFLAMLVETVHGQEKEAMFTGLVSSGAALGGFLAGIVIGRLSDTLPAEKLLYPLLICSVAGTLGQGLANNIYLLLVLRFATFFAAGGLMPVLQVIMARNTDPDFRGTFFGMSNSINTAGGVICALLSGSIAYFLDVRSIMIAASVIFLLMIPLAAHTFTLLKRRAVRL